MRHKAVGAARFASERIGLHRSSSVRGRACKCLRPLEFPLKAIIPYSPDFCQPTVAGCGV
jgi:hypothetical protein